jgi:hypothetical protein
MSANEPKPTFKPKSYASRGGTPAEKHNEKVEQPNTNCGYSGCHIGPSGGPQNLLHAGYLFVASDDALAYQ